MVNLLIFFIVLLQALDLWTTYKILKGGGRELNPFLNKLFSAIGVLPGLILAKSVFVLLVFIYGNTVPYVVLILILVGYTVVVTNNFKVLKGLKK